MSIAAIGKIDDTLHLETTRLNLDTIVAAVDLSPASEKTVQVAAHVARLFNSRLFVSHIFQHSDVLKDVQLENARRHVGKLCRLAASDNIQPIAVLRQGSVVEEIQWVAGEPAARILSVAGECKSDVIIMSVNQAPSDRQMPWTIATEVVNHANCPVLTVRNKA